MRRSPRNWKTLKGCRKLQKLSPHSSISILLVGRSNKILLAFGRLYNGSKSYSQQYPIAQRREVDRLASHVGRPSLGLYSMHYSELIKLFRPNWLSTLNSPNTTGRPTQVALVQVSMYCKWYSGWLPTWTTWRYWRHTKTPLTRRLYNIYQIA